MGSTIEINVNFSTGQIIWSDQDGLVINYSTYAPLVEGQWMFTILPSCFGDKFDIIRPPPKVEIAGADVDECVSDHGGDEGAKIQHLEKIIGAQKKQIEEGKNTSD